MLPVGCSKVQEIETKRAFFAGGFSILMLLKGLPEDISEDNGIKYLASLESEFLNYFKRLGTIQE